MYKVDLQKKKDLERLEQEKATLKDDLENTERKLKSVNKSLKDKSKEIKDLEEENATVTDNFIRVQTDFAQLKQQINTEKLNEKKSKKKEVKNHMQLSEFSCEKCEKKVKTFQEIQSHMRMQHTKSSSCQSDLIKVEEKFQQYLYTDVTKEKATQAEEKKVCEFRNFEKYPCFYCATEITNESQLQEHKKSCHKVSRFLRANSSIKDQFEKPENQQIINFYQKMLESWQKKSFKCSVCGSDYESENMVKLHKMADHQVKYENL